MSPKLRRFVKVRRRHQPVIGYMIQIPAKVPLPQLTHAMPTNQIAVEYFFGLIDQIIQHQNILCNQGSIPYSCYGWYCFEKHFLLFFTPKFLHFYTNFSWTKTFVFFTPFFRRPNIFYQMV